MDHDDLKIGQAGTLESMDCLVVITEAGAENAGRVVEIAGSASERFRTAMRRRVNEALDSMEESASGLRIVIQDNGALDIVLGARVEAAYRRFKEGGTL